MSDMEHQNIMSDEDAGRKLQERISEVIAPYAKRLGENVARISSLIGLFKSLNKSTEFASSSSKDEILRASVVFIHATLEDFLRTLAVRLYPEADELALSQIPLVGLDFSSGRAEKFSLGKLAQYKGKSVDDVIALSVSNYFERSNFNTVTDISVLLKSLGFDVSKVNRSFPKLDELMQRRHLIVHRADRSEPIGSDEQSVQNIEVSNVEEWLQAVLQFFQDVIPDAAKRHLIVQGYIKIEDNIVKLTFPKTG